MIEDHWHLSSELIRDYALFRSKNSQKIQQDDVYNGSVNEE